MLFLMSLGLVACSSDATDDSATDTGTTTAETVPVRESLRSEFLESQLGIFFSTDLTVDFISLKELGTGLEFMERSMHSWGRDHLAGQPIQVDWCVDVDPTADPDVFTLQFDDCFVGMNRDRKLNASGTASFNGFEFTIDLEWSIRLESFANLSGTHTAVWENLFQSPEATSRANIEMVYKGGSYVGRTVTVTDALVIVPERSDWSSDFIIPSTGSPATGFKITWRDREDSLDLGVSLERQKDNTYAGKFWGTYTGVDGQEIAITNGTITEQNQNDVIVDWEASLTSENKSIQLSSVSQTWPNQKAEFSGAAAFSFTSSSTTDVGAWSTPLQFTAYSIDPLQISGSQGVLSASGPVEFGLISEDSAGQEHDAWFFGNCNDLSQAEVALFPHQGSCSFGNAAKESLHVHYTETTPDDGWILVDDGSGKWICRNLRTHAEQEAGSTDGSPESCPN